MIKHFILRPPTIKAVQYKGVESLEHIKQIFEQSSIKARGFEIDEDNNVLIFLANEGKGYAWKEVSIDQWVGIMNDDELIIMDNERFHKRFGEYDETLVPPAWVAIDSNLEQQTVYYLNNR